MHGSKGVLERTLSLPGFKQATLSLAQRFVAGTTPREALNEVGFLNAHGFSVVMNLLGEGDQGKTEVKTAEEVYLTLLSAFKKESLKSEISLKAAEFGLEPNHSQCPICYRWWEDNPEILSILEEADKDRARFWLDAELLDNRKDIWNFAISALKNVSFLGVAYQAYGDNIFNSEIFFNDVVRPLITSLQKGKTLGIRLCKGAYRSSEKWILRDQGKIRERYLALAWQMIKLALVNNADKEKGNLFLEFATHDPILIQGLKNMSRALGLPKNKFRFAMLLGRQQSLASHLAAERFEMAIYLPFGQNQISYVSRRLQENWSHLLLPLRREGAYHICPLWPEACYLD